MKSMLFAILLLAPRFCCCAMEAPIEDDPLLTVGDAAPALEIEHWLSDGDGRFPHVGEFEKGKVYVIEFWATWCGPCVASMPHISETQDQYADKGVQIISVSDEDLEVVKEFLEQSIPDDDEITFQELTRNYCLTTDPDQSVHEDYMKAAGQSGIPTAFIVGTDGKIEWIGHPMEMQEPLEQVIDGTWDRAAFAEQIRVEQEINKQMGEAIALLQQGEMDEGLAIVEALIEKAPAGELQNQLKLFRLSILFSTNDERVVEAFLDLAKASQADAMMLNQLAWGVVEMVDGGEPVDPELLKTARQAIDWAVQAEPDDASILDTQAHIAQIQGQLDEAIDIQTRAVEHADSEMRDDLARYLEALKKEKQDGAKEDPDEPEDDPDDGDDDGVNGR